MAEIVLALGTNVGDRLQNLSQALRGVSKFANVKAVSKIYETIPVGFLEQADFLNAALYAETEESPHKLLELCKNLEREIGRVPTFKDGPRVVDIDIIFYNAQKISSENLEIPHPRWSERDFVVTPLLDLREQGAFAHTSLEEYDALLDGRAKAFEIFGEF